MTVTMPIVTKLTLTIHVFVKDIYNEFYKNLKNGLVADTSSPTDKFGLHVRGSAFYFVNKVQKLFLLIKGGAKRTHVFQIIVTSFIFNIKKLCQHHNSL